EKTAEEIDTEVNLLVQRAHAKAKDVLKTNKAKLIKLAEALITNETIDGEALNKLLNDPAEEVAAVEPPIPQQSEET
ncbi:MAG: cell division protein FtsH, partial [Chloroflexota bacterium]|nr:cell division protein FtsH [Chloroflexota bacterium]